MVEAQRIVAIRGAAARVSNEKEREGSSGGVSDPTRTTNEPNKGRQTRADRVQYEPKGRQSTE